MLPDPSRNQRGAANGVPLDSVDEQGLRQLEPLACTVERALFSPSTSVADPAAVVRAVATDVERLGGRVLLGSRVVSARPGIVTTPSQVWAAGHIVNCAGLYADRIAQTFGMCDDYVVLPFKGVYRYGDWEPGRLQRHVYPVPSVRPQDFRERGRPGIRAQLARRDTGALEMDFVVRGDERSTHILNAVSPAWTSALAFAEHVVAGVRDRGAA